MNEKTPYDDMLRTLINSESTSEDVKRELNVELELREAGCYHPDIANNVNAYLNNWIKSKNPDYLDLLLVFCEHNSVPIVAPILREVAVAAGLRISRDSDTCKLLSKQNKAIFSMAHNEVMFAMMKMMEFCDFETVDDAAKNGAKIWVNRFQSFGNRTASTLRQDYGKWKKENQPWIDRIKSARPDGWSNEEKKAFLNQFDSVGLPDYLMGVMR